MGKMNKKLMNIKDFRELGLLQEINRQLLHPLGLALEVKIDVKTGEESLSGIRDCRDDDDEGVYFGISNKSEKEKQIYKEIQEDHYQKIKKFLEFVIEEIRE